MDILKFHTVPYMTKVTHPLELSTTLFPTGLYIYAAGMNLLDMNCCYDVSGLISTVYKLLPGLYLFQLHA